MRLLVVPLLLALIGAGHGAKILALFPFPARSHMISFTALMQELARRGHQVTVVSSFPVKPAIPNHNDIMVEDIFPEKNNLNSFTQFRNDGGIGMLIGVFFFFGIGVTSCERALQQPAIQKLIQDQDSKYDVIFLENFMCDCFYGFIHKHKTPVINMSPASAALFMGDNVGNPFTPSYIPDLMLGYSDHMTFMERVKNTLITAFFVFFRHLYYLPKQDALIRQYFKDPTFPGISTIETNGSLLLINSHVSMGYPRPFTPNTIEVGGMHIKEPKQLPKDLQQFMDSAPHGVIYFSLGSNVKSSDMPPELLKVFLSVFSRLKQQVLWKWEKDSLPGQPSNVRLGKWLPQSDILAHPNLRVFITHGGLLSAQESIYRAVPMLAIPVMADQKNNARRAVDAGYALMLDPDEVTQESLSQALEQLVANSSYRDTIKRLSALFRDRPMSALDTAVYWTEYIVRHKGAPHMHSAALDLHWYQYHLLDVLAVLTVVPLLALTAIVLVCRALCCRKKQPIVSPKKKKH